MVHKISKSSSQIALLKNAYANDIYDFETEELGVDDAMLAVDAIGGYGGFNHSSVNRAIGSTKGDIGAIKVGREGSPVLYIRLLNNDAQTVERVKSAFMNASADELTLNDRTLRVWWD